MIKVIGGFSTARLPGQVTCAADPLRVSISNNHNFIWAMEPASAQSTSLRFTFVTLKMVTVAGNKARRLPVNKLLAV